MSNLGPVPPRWPFTIDWDDPDSVGLVAAWPLCAGPYLVDVVRGRKMVWVGTPGLKPMQPAGLVAQFDGTTNYLVYASAVVTAAPLTLACWFNGDLQTSDDTLMAIYRSTNSAVGFGMVAQGNVAGDPIRITTNDGTSSTADSPAPGFVALRNNHAAAVFASETSRVAYLNGRGGTPETTSRVPTTLTRTMIGARNVANPTGLMQGRIAFAEIYNVGKSADAVRRMYDQATRFNRYYELGRRSYFFVASGAVSLTPDDLTAAPSLDASALTQIHALAPADLAAAPVLDAAGLTQHHLLAPADATAAPGLDASALTQNHELAPADLTAAATLDETSVSESGNPNLLPADLTATATLESAGLTQHHLLAPADLAASPSLDASALTQIHELAVADATAGPSLDACVLSQIHVVLPADLTAQPLLDAASLVNPTVPAPGRRTVAIAGSGRLGRTIAASGRLGVAVAADSRSRTV